MEFKNKEYYEIIRQTYYALAEFRPDILESLGVKNIPEFIEEAAVQYMATIHNQLADVLVGEIYDTVREINRKTET